MSNTNSQPANNGPQGNQQGNQPGQPGGAQNWTGSVESDNEDQPGAGASEEEE